jgi:hypothetical protein
MLDGLPEQIEKINDNLTEKESELSSLINNK